MQMPIKEINQIQWAVLLAYIGLNPIYDHYGRMNHGNHEIVEVCLDEMFIVEGIEYEVIDRKLIITVNYT